MWKIYNNILLTLALLKHCLYLQDESLGCPICNSTEETVSHLFLECPYSRVLWRQSPWSINFISTDINSWIVGILNPDSFLQIDNEDINKFQLFAVITMDNLWFYRNQVIHDQKKINILQLIEQVKKSFKDHCRAWEWKKQQKGNDMIPSPIHHISINFDVAVRDN